jgi:hypothetical protein
MQTLYQGLHYDSKVNEERIYYRYLNVFSRTVEVSQLAKIRIHQSCISGVAVKLALIFAENSDDWSQHSLRRYVQAAPSVSGSRSLIRWQECIDALWWLDCLHQAAFLILSKPVFRTSRFRSCQES